MRFRKIDYTNITELYVKNLYICPSLVVTQEIVDSVDVVFSTG